MSNEDPFHEPDPMANPPSSDFFSGGAPSCKFNKIGDVHRGTILTFEEAQQRDITTGEPKSWKDGNPAMMLVITLQTEERDANIDDDDGTRRLYVNKPGGMFSAIKKAIGQSRFLPGGKLAVKYTGNGTPTQRGFNPPKEYMAHYVPPGVNGSANGGGQGAPAPTAAAAPQQQYPRNAGSIRREQRPAVPVPAGDVPLPESGEVDPGDIPF